MMHLFSKKMPVNRVNPVNQEELKIREEDLKIFTEVRAMDANREKRLRDSYVEYRGFVEQDGGNIRYSDSDVCDSAPDFPSELAKTECFDTECAFIDGVMQDKYDCQPISGYLLAVVLFDEARIDLAVYIFKNYNTDNPKYLGFLEYFANNPSNAAPTIIKHGFPAYRAFIELARDMLEEHRKLEKAKALTFFILPLPLPSPTAEDDWILSSPTAQDDWDIIEDMTENSNVDMLLEQANKKTKKTSIKRAIRSLF